MKKIILSVLIFSKILSAKDIEIIEPYVKETPPNAKNSAIFLKIKNNTNENLKLLKAETNLTDIVELHTNIKEDDKIMMIPIPNIEIKSNSQTELKPGGMHIMLFDLKQNITKDTNAWLILYFDNNQSITIDKISIKKITNGKH